MPPGTLMVKMISGFGARIPLCRGGSLSRPASESDSLPNGERQALLGYPPLFSRQGERG